MDEEYSLVFQRLGYNIKLKGAMLFSDLISEVRELLKEGNTDKEIKKILPSICLEYYHFCYECGKNRYYSEINDFLSSKNVTRKNAAYNRKIIGSKKKMELDDTVLLFSKYFNKLEKKQKSHEKELPKVYVKKYN